jgi:hypothetical protein
VIRRIRLVVGLALLAWSAWIVVREPTRRSRDRFGWDEGRPTGIRIAPLAPAERAAALELEERLRRAWLT